MDSQLKALRGPFKLVDVRERNKLPFRSKNFHSHTLHLPESVLRDLDWYVAVCLSLQKLCTDSLQLVSMKNHGDMDLGVKIGAQDFIAPEITQVVPSLSSKSGQV